MINVFIILCMIIGFRISIYAGILMIVMVSVIKIEQYFKKKKLNDDLERISKQIDDILYHDKQLYIKNYNEGSMYILENEIQKLVLKLGDQNKQLQKERIVLKESLEDVSHQVKTPLTSLNLIVERLKDNHLTTREKNNLLKEEIQLLDKIEWLIRSLLKLAQIDAHSIEFVEEKVECRFLIQKLMEPFEILMDLKNIELECSYLEDTYISCDQLWTLEALSNIVKNCIEHLDVDGKLMITIQHNALYDEIIIEDNGSGIASEDLPHLFERFYKGKNSSTTGVGIGLALSKKIIENQNGTITVENCYPGAKFTIHFYKEVV